uniref:(northern house mosquito) hypothetical protein n=1 Tax=Culex pipiens TaxID=7175 RepID=A0A8D8CKF0_CULPI
MIRARHLSERLFAQSQYVLFLLLLFRKKAYPPISSIGRPLRPTTIFRSSGNFVFTSRSSSVSSRLCSSFGMRRRPGVNWVGSKEKGGNVSKFVKEEVFFIRKRRGKIFGASFIMFF